MVTIFPCKVIVSFHPKIYFGLANMRVTNSKQPSQSKYVGRGFALPLDGIAFYF